MSKWWECDMPGHKPEWWARGIRGTTAPDLSARCLRRHRSATFNESAILRAAKAYERAAREYEADARRRLARTR